MNRKSRSRLIFGIVMGVVTIFLLWPGYQLFSSMEPFILGVPLSFAWVILCTLVGFAALLTLYISDKSTQKED